MNDPSAHDDPRQRDAPPPPDAPLSTPEGASAGDQTHRAGKVRPMVLLWSLGVPLPIVLIIALVLGCS